MSNFPQSSVAKKANPLAGYMRQPKIYIGLPSNGAYWTKGSIEMPDNRELAVYSMTAKDELAFKTPDALMNGQAIVDVIQSCIPAIKDAWKCPNVDFDMILIAIRIATYGEMMEVSHTVPNTEIEVEHQIDLRVLLDQLVNNSKWEDQVEINDQLTCYVRPLTYRHMTMTSLKTFETQRLMQAVTDDNIDEEKKLEIFNKSFNKMTDITIDLISDSVSAIKTPDTVVDDPAFIREFVANADKDVFQKIQKHLDKMKGTNGIQPMTVTASPEQVEAGAPETYELPISLDNSDFFAKGS